MLEQLKRILKQDDTVLFIGSGVSQWSGIPTWYGFIKELVEFLRIRGVNFQLVEKEVERGDYLQAASYGFDKLTKSQIAEFIRESCRIGKAKPSEIHNKIITLGPTCFITTNYDNLLELSFQKWLPETQFRLVINTQLVETAEIVGARASHFLFKLHGDAGSSDSIVLTREQYRSLSPGGDLNHALETSKTLMVSRPIVYIGFGLKDPDFLYVKDLLLNIYKGGTRDHYAIVADIGDQERDYWRRNFGIHLISYETVLKHDGKNDHSNLLKLLDELVAPKTHLTNHVSKIDSDFILGLTRHAAKYIWFENAPTHIPLVVHPLENKKREFTPYRYQFYGDSVERLLDEGPSKLILIGLPGSGKSYALKASALRLAKKLHEICIADRFNATECIIPIYVDLKLYKGNIRNLVEETTPSGMSLDFLLEHFKVKVLLDAFNEIPREYIESNRWDGDFSSFLNEAKITSLVIASRTEDGLDKFDFPIFILDSINEQFVRSKLAEAKLELNGVFKDDILDILQRPFFYKLAFESDFTIDSETSPNKIYSDLLNLINLKFQKRFETNLSLSEALSSAATNAIDNGLEAFSQGILIELLDRDITNANLSHDSKDIINWLVGQNFLVPIVNERVCFFHQSVTEYLAAIKLAYDYESNPNILKEKLLFRRWDQAIFLALSVLKRKSAETFLESIIEIDFDFVLLSARYIEGDTKEIVQKLLLAIEAKDFSNNDLIMTISYYIEHRLPITKFHSGALRKIVAKGGSIGGAAASKLLDLHGNEYKGEAYKLLVERSYDFNFCQELSHAVHRLTTTADLINLVKITASIQKRLLRNKRLDYDGFETAIAFILKDFDAKTVYSNFFKKGISVERQMVHIGILCRFLEDSIGNEGLKVACALLEDNIQKATSAVSFILEFADEKSDLDYSIFYKKHIDFLIDCIERAGDFEEVSALNSLKFICIKRTDFDNLILAKAKKCRGILKAALLYVTVRDGNYFSIFTELATVCDLTPDQLSHEPFSLLQPLDNLDWQNNLGLFLKLLKLRNADLAYSLLESAEDYGRRKENFIIEFDSIGWLLDWLVDLNGSNYPNPFLFQVSSFIASHISRQQRKELIEEFNDPQSKYRDVLNNIVLNKMEDLSLDELNENSISYLLEQLKVTKVSIFNSNVLVNVATEKFVSDNLLPMLKFARGLHLDNLKAILEMTGRNHGRRYID